MKSNMRASLAAVLHMLVVVAGRCNATIIEVDVSNVAGNLWQYDYTITNNSLPAGIGEFTIYFDRAHFDLLAVVASPSGWDSLVVQSDPNIPADGFFDSLAIGDSLGLGSVLSGFSVQFIFNGTGAPSSQLFEIIGPGFDVLESGITSVHGAPEPSSAWLALIAFIALVGAYRSGGALERRRCITVRG